MEMEFGNIDKQSQNSSFTTNNSSVRVEDTVKILIRQNNVLKYFSAADTLELLTQTAKKNCSCLVSNRPFFFRFFSFFVFIFVFFLRSVEPLKKDLEQGYNSIASFFH